MADPNARSRVDLARAPTVGAVQPLAGWLLVLAGAYTVLAAGALAGRPWVFGPGLLLVLVAEIGFTRREHFGEWAAESAGIGPGARALVRGLFAATLAARCGAGPGSLTTIVLAWCALAVIGAAGQLALAAVGWLGKSPLLARNLDVGAIRVGRPSANLLRAGPFLPLVDVALLIGVFEAARLRFTAAGRAWLGTGAVISLGAALLVLALLAFQALRLRRADPRRRLPAAIQQAVRELQPDAILYHSGEVRSTYQIDAWTSALEQLGRRVLIVVRHTSVLDALRPTSLPVICITPATLLADFDFGGAAMAFLVGNGSGNIHLFRRHDLAFVFIGHGDSDKATSATPLARVYDEIWVAGPAARERYLRAGVELRPDVIREIGRPQLAELRAREITARASDLGQLRPAEQRTVLYAPTWEGWGDERYVASLATVGPELVSRLLAAPGVRLIYRPHPLTGSRDPALRAADRRVRELVRGAGAPHVAVTDGEPDLLDCFAQADLLVSDISALLSDWLATDRPYVVVDPGDVDPVTFVRDHPTAAGATVLDRSLGGLDQVLSDLLAGRDPEGEVRRALAVEVLGPLPADPVQPMRDAVDALLVGRRARVPRPTNEAPHPDSTAKPGSGAAD